MYHNYPQLQKQIIVQPRSLEDMNPEVIMEVVENVFQSEENLKMAEGFEIHLDIARMEKGGANGTPITNVQEARLSKSQYVSYQRTR